MMNDFLQQLHKGKNKQGRKPYDGHFRAVPEHKPGQGQNGQTKTETEPDKLTAIEKVLEQIIAIQTRLASIKDRRAGIAERKAQAFEEGLRLINEIAERFMPSGQEDGSSPPNAFVASIDDADIKSPFCSKETRDEYRQEVFQVIVEMRKDGATYDEIASHLEKKKMPTFSGRGGWHAQTIHRICREIDTIEHR